MITHSNIKAFLKDKRLNNIINSDNTMRSYETRLMAWHRFCNGDDTNEFAQKYFEKILSKSYSSIQVQNTLYVLKSFYDWQNNGGNPFESIAKKYHVNKKESHIKKTERDSRVLTASEITQLISYAESIFCKINSKEDSIGYYLAYRNWFIINMMAEYGMRISGLIGVDIDDIDFPRRCMTIWDSKNGTPYPVPIKTKMSLLASYCNVRHSKMKDISGNEKALLLSKTGKRLSDTSARRAINRLATEIGIYDSGRSTHQLRHYRATQYCKDNMPLDLISTIMGLSVPVLKKTYLHLTDDDTIRQYEGWLDSAKAKDGFVCPKCGYSDKEIIERTELRIVR